MNLIKYINAPNLLFEFCFIYSWGFLFLENLIYFLKIIYLFIYYLFYGSISPQNLLRECRITFEQYS